MENLIFLKAYKDNSILRNSLSDLIQSNYSYSLEEWYNRGGWQEQYIPYSFVEGNQVVANISVYKQDVLYHDQIRSAISLEHILLHPKYHYKHLLEELMANIINEYKDQVEMIYFIGDEDVTPIYPHFGFRYVEDVQNCILVDQMQGGIVPVRVNEEVLIQKLKQYPETFTILSKGLKRKNNLLKRDFDYMSTKNADAYYFDEINTYVMVQVQHQTLYIKDILTKQKVDLDYIIKGLKTVYEFNKVIIYSDLPYEGCGNLYEEKGNQLLFIRDQISEEEGLFPIYVC